MLRIKVNVTDVTVVGRRQVNDDSQPAVNRDWVNFGTGHGNGF